MLKERYAEFLDRIDTDRILKHTLELGREERGQTFGNYHRAAEYARKMLEEYGFSDVRKIDFPADGKTTYHDKTMPLGWTASVGKLTLLRKQSSKGWQPVGSEQREESDVLADFRKEPFHLVKGSVALPPGGVVTEIITEQQFQAGKDPRGTLVLFDSDTWPRAAAINAVLDQGALGFVTDFLKGRYETPDAVQWLNAGTASGNWHVTAEDRPFIGFSVSPRTGDRIRELADAGQVKVRVECDGRRYEDTVSVVTALVPGKRPEELWIIAHLYEPLLNDDSCGVAAAAEIADMIRKRGTPEYTVRLVFAMEFYGFAAYAASLGQPLNDRVIGACNLDTLIYYRDCRLNLVPAGPAIPFAGNALLERMYGELREELPLRLCPSAYFDDDFLGDPEVGIPTVWIHGTSAEFWHNSRQCDPSFLIAENLKKAAAFACVFLSVLAEGKAGPAVKLPVSVTDKHSVWRDYADGIVMARKLQGFPYSLAAVPPDDRIALPDGMLYGPFANVLANMDGKKTLARLIREAEAETGAELTEGQVKKTADAINFLADYGYLTVVRRPEIRSEHIAAALAEVGISDKDTLLVHASVSGCGYIRGGAETIIDTLRAHTDTVLFTTFTRPYIYLGGPCHDWSFRPYAPDDWKAVWTGAVGMTIVRKYPDALRSRHITHSWAGFGSKAHFCLDAHEPCDAPANENSPLAKALERDGKVLFFGCGLSSNTFLHHLEDVCRLPFLEDAVCMVRNPDGSRRAVTVPRHLPGHRDFYRGDFRNAKFYRQAFAEGLTVRETALGIGKLYCMDLKQLYEIGLTLLKRDPRILLCDDPECLFCRRFR